MRLGIVLAATGAAVTAWAVAAAQDGNESRGIRPTAAATGRTLHYFSRNGATSQRAAPTTPAPIPGVRNYYEELFAEPGETDGTAPSVRTAGGSDADSTGLMNADYDRQAGRSAAGTVRQVSERSARPSATQRLLPRGSSPPPRTSRMQPVQETNPFLQTAAESEPPAFEDTTIDPSLDEEPAAESPLVDAVEMEAVPETAELSVPTQDLMPQAEPSVTDAGLNPFSAMERQSPETAPQNETPSAPAFGSSAPEASPAPVASAPFSASPAFAPVVRPMDRFAETDMGGPAAVEVRWEKISEITVGRECRCELVVKNTGAGAAGEVAVEAFFPKSVRLVDADPKPTAAADHLTWTIAALPAGAERRISVTLVPSEQGDLQVSAFVRYTEAAATTLAVREPLLRVEMTGPQEVAMGETVSQTITISNPGSGTADDVTVEAFLPVGLEHARGSRIAMPIGSLAPGQQQVIRLALFATEGGPQEIRVRAAAGETLRQEAASTVLVSAPALKVVAEGPGLRYVGRDATYRVRVTNDGAATANNVRVVQDVPEGFTFLRADNGGRLEAAEAQIVWYLGSIGAGQSLDLAAELTAAKLGTHKHLVTVFGEGGAKAETAVETAVDGTASLVIEVIDLDDPVEVGAETAYEIRVRNEGTKAATNVAVACQVPAGVATLSARGPTQPHGEKGTVAFPPVEQLEPGKTALYRVVVKGETEGKHRFRVRLTSDSIDEPLIHEELTHYYAD